MNRLQDLECVFFIFDGTLLYLLIAKYPEFQSSIHSVLRHRRSYKPVSNREVSMGILSLSGIHHYIQRASEFLQLLRLSAIHFSITLYTINTPKSSECTEKQKKLKPRALLKSIQQMPLTRGTQQKNTDADKSVPLQHIQRQRCKNATGEVVLLFPDTDSSIQHDGILVCCYCLGFFQMRQRLYYNQRVKLVGLNNVSDVFASSFVLLFISLNFTPIYQSLRINQCIYNGLQALWHLSRLCNQIGCKAVILKEFPSQE